MRVGGQPFAEFVVEQEHHGRCRPGNGVAQGDGEIAQVREGHGEQQNQPQHTRAEERDDCGLDRISDAAHHGRQHLRRREQEVARGKIGDNHASLLDDCGVRVEQTNRPVAREVDEPADQRAYRKVQRDADVHGLQNPVFFPRAVVLPREGHDGNADGVGNRPEDAVELPVDRPRRDRVRAEQIDCLLDIDVRNVIKHAGNAGGKPDDEHALEQPPVRADFFEVQAVVSVRALQGADDQPRADEL